VCYKLINTYAIIICHKSKTKVLYKYLETCTIIIFLCFSYSCMTSILIVFMPVKLIIYMLRVFIFSAIAISLYFSRKLWHLQRLCGSKCSILSEHSVCTEIFIMAVRLYSCKVNNWLIFRVSSILITFSSYIYRN